MAQYIVIHIYSYYCFVVLLLLLLMLFIVVVVKITKMLGVKAELTSWLKSFPTAIQHPVNEISHKTLRNQEIMTCSSLMNRSIGHSLCLYSGGPGFTKYSQDYRQSGLLYFKFKFTVCYFSKTITFLYIEFKWCYTF